MRLTEGAEQKLREQVALFRYGVIADLIHLEPGTRGIYAKLREKAERDYDIPGSSRRRVAAETIRSWLSDYRGGGFDALMPKKRRDDGQARALPAEVCDLLLMIKDDRRELSVKEVIECASASGEVPPEVVLAPSTVHRLLSRHGLMKQPRAATKDRRRFSFEMAGELWMSDVMHGPAVVSKGRRKKKSYLLALIDDATRLVPHAAFAFHENASAFLPVLEQGIVRRGRPKRLYVDNGAVYRSQHLALVCARLGITLIHARPYQPQGKGKIERLFRTIRMQLIKHLGEDDLKSLDAINARLWAFIESEYHQSPHKGLGGKCPADAWTERSERVEFETGDISDLFLFENKRKVQRDRTVSLEGTLLEVEAELVGETVTLRFDPSGRKRTIQVWRGGKRFADAKPVDAYANCFVRRDRLSSKLDPVEPPEGLRMRDFERRDESEES